MITDSVISTRKAIEASSTYNNCQPSNAVDGLIRTNDPDVCLCAATQAETDPWFKLDLGDRFFITLIKLYGRTDGNTTGRKLIRKFPTRRQHNYLPHDYISLFVLNSTEHEISMLDKCHLINLLEKLLIASADQIKLLNWISHTLSSINDTFKFEDKLS